MRLLDKAVNKFVAEEIGCLRNNRWTNITDKRRLRSAKRYTAVTNTIQQILESGAIPIVNENDTVSAEEIKFGDNDTLSALVAKATESDLLLILSNIPGLMDTKNQNTIIHQVETD